MSADVAKLAGLPLFGQLSEAERETLNGLFTTVGARRGDPIFRQGDPGNSLYFVRTGRVQIILEDLDGQRIVVSENGPGSIFGEVSLLDGGPRTADALAAVDTVLLTLDRDDLLEFVTKHPPASLALLTVMGQRLRSTNELLRAHTSRNANDEEKAHRSAASYVTDLMVGLFGSWGGAAAAFALGVVGGGLAFTEPAAHAVMGRDPLLLWLGATVVLVAFLVAGLLMARKQQGDRERLKADLDYQFDLKSELEMARLHRKLDDIDERLKSQLAGLEMDKALGSPGRAAPA
jgi:CRP/FNR family transcriptional regulator, cyclic AMP receptor protein